MGSTDFAYVTRDWCALQKQIEFFFFLHFFREIAGEIFDHFLFQAAEGGSGTYSSAGKMGSVGKELAILSEDPGF